MVDDRAAGPLTAAKSAVYRARQDGVDLFVRLTPKSSRDSIDGPDGTADGAVHLNARVRAVPEKGAANAALERLVADRLGLPKRTVSVVGGATSRLKTVHISGEPAAIAKAIRQLLAEAGG